MPVSFTAIVPTHNRRERLLMALESVLVQTRPPEQILVVADGCTDGSVKAVEGLGDERIEVLDMPKGHRLGWPHRNEALRRRRGDVVAYLSDDDLWFPDHLARIGEVFDAGGADVVQAHVALVDERGELTEWGQDWRVPLLRDELLERRGQHRTPMSAVSHRAGLAEEAGGWPRDPDGPGDADLWRRMLRCGAWSAMLMEPTVLFFPAYAGSRSGDKERQTRAFLDRVLDPAERARLRMEISLSAHGGAAEAFAERDERIAALESEVEALRARSATLDRITSGGWWRLRGRLLPVLRAAGRLGRRG